MERRFLRTKVRNLAARARRLSRFDREVVGIRPQDLPYCPSDAHFAVANQRLSEIDARVREHLAGLVRLVDQPTASTAEILARAALVEREVDRARRAFGLFFDIFTQRGTRFAPALAACDTVAQDCFQVVRRNAPGVLGGPLLKPVSYLEHSFSPATFRRGVMLRRLLGERNPFPLVRIPYERVASPWGMGVVLHEIGHNLQADMGVWHETRAALQRRLLSATQDPWLTRIWTRWHKEIFADLIALLLGGPAAARSMMDFLAYPGTRVMTFRPLGVHPTPWLRTFIMAEMMERMGFGQDAAAARAVWRGLYGADAARSRIPARLLESAARVIPHVVDEVAYQTRRGLAQRALADAVPFGREEQRCVKEAARAIGRGEYPAGLPPRFAVSASRYAFEEERAPPSEIAHTVLRHLAQLGARQRDGAPVPQRVAA